MEIIERLIKKFKKRFPFISEERLERELIPLKPGKELEPIVKKKKK
jgi:hypothetical protein